MIKLCTALGALFLFIAAAGNGAFACGLPEGWNSMKPLEDINGKLPEIQAALKITPETIEVGQPFTVDIATCIVKEGAIERFSIGASMPAHKHGMNYRPELSNPFDNRFRGENMLFHMPGKWQIDFAAFLNGKPARMMLEVEVK